MKPVDADSQRRERFTQGRTTEEQQGTGQAASSTSIPAWLSQCKLILDEPAVVPGWGCCQCKTYNGLQRDDCKLCGHACCVKKPKPEEYGLCNICGVPEGIPHVGH